MSIDWITVAAQIANFLVLVWLMKRFLYRPILDGIDAREAEISNRMQEALDAKAQAEATEATFHDKVRALDAAQSEMSETIRKSAEVQRDVLLEEAREKMAQEHAGWQAHMADEARTYTARMHRAGGDALLSLTRKALNDLADETLEDRMARHLAVQLRMMADELQSAAGEVSEAIVVSHLPLSAGVQEELSNDIGALFEDMKVRFETDAEHAVGLVVRMGGAQVAWSVDSYIDGLDGVFAEQLAANPTLKAQTR